MKQNRVISKTKFIAMIISLIIFICVSLGLIFKVKAMHRLDLNTYNWWLHHTGSPQMNFTDGLLNSYFTLFAKYFDVLTVVILTIIIASVFIYRKYYSFAFWLMGTVASGGSLGIILKGIFHRARPYDHLLADSGFSFPSGHSLSSSLLFVLLIVILIPKVQHLWLQIILNAVSIFSWISILMSRLYFHAHFMTDVIGGISFGVFWVIFCMWLYNKVVNPLFNKTKLNNKIYDL